MIIVITTDKNTYTHKCLAAEPSIDVRVMGYRELHENAANLPVATYIFTDSDRLLPRQLHQAAVYYRSLRAHGLKVLNDPARVRSRFGLLRSLHREGINQFDAYRVENLEQPRQWPVFLRIEGNHSQPVSDLLHSQAELDAAIESCVEAGLPRAALLIIEYASEPAAPGIFRKLSVFRIGDRLLGYTCVHDNQWIVKYGNPAVTTPELYEEEHRFVVENPFADELRRVFAIAGVEYGRADFGLVDGKPQIYEINTNPDLNVRQNSSASQRRNESALFVHDQLVDAFRTLDADNAAAGGAGAAALTA